MYTTGQTYDGIRGNAALPHINPALAHMRAFELSQSDIASCQSCAGEDESYATQRLFSNIPLTQSYGDLPPVILNNKVTYMNPVHLEGVVNGLGTACGAGGTYIGAGEASLKSLQSMGGQAGGRRVEDVVGTVSGCYGMDPKRWECENTRPFMASDTPTNLNLRPIDEYAVASAENACRINSIRMNTIKSQIAAFASASF
jgi:hypothetical protein